MKIFWDEPFDVEKCIVCLEPAVVFTGHLMLGPIAVGAGFCKKHENTALAKDGCFGIWESKYGLEKTGNDYD